jgi:hypothetical protein
VQPMIARGKHMLPQGAARRIEHREPAIPRAPTSSRGATVASNRRMRWSLSSSTQSSPCGVTTSRPPG